MFCANIYFGLCINAQKRWTSPDSTRIQPVKYCCRTKVMHNSRSKFTLQKSLLSRRKWRSGLYCQSCPSASVVLLAQFWGPIQVLPKWPTFREKRAELYRLTFMPENWLRKWAGSKRVTDKSMNTPETVWNTYSILSDVLITWLTHCKIELSSKNALIKIKLLIVS